MGTIPTATTEESISVEEILDVLQGLIRHLHDDMLDLDAIDGEFYWRCCRKDFHADLAQALALLPNYGECEGYEEALVTPQELEAEAAHERAQFEAFERAMKQLVIRYEPDDPLIEQHLYQQEGWDWIRLREGRMTHYPAGPKNILGTRLNMVEDRLELRVLSSRWTGKEVESRLRTHLDNPFLGDRNRQQWTGATPLTDQSVIRVAFEFAHAGSEVVDFSRRWVEEWPAPTLALPHVVVTVAPPFPPEGTIARLYDDIVLGHHRWHERLAGTPARQEKRIALRTWAIGLLVGAGNNTARAINDVAALLGEGAISQVQFTEDRQRLVDRVPEAQPYLYAKPPRRPMTGHK